VVASQLLNAPDRNCSLEQQETAENQYICILLLVFRLEIYNRFLKQHGAQPSLNMLFNSLQFLVFFGFVTCSFYLVPVKWRWILLLLSSCYFYMVFVPEYILILLFTIVIDFCAGHLIERSAGKTRKLWLILSITANLGILLFYKYFNFFNVNASHLLSCIGVSNPVKALQIILPIGLSFHTFQAMSYTLEVYRGNQRAEKHFGIYSLYVLFYPQLVAGPIERPQNLLPQLKESSPFNRIVVQDALLRMAWGFFKKVVIADRLSVLVDDCYAHTSGHNIFTLWIGVFFYAIQIYCDFSGYTDMALGAAEVMGIRLMENFNAPYLSASLHEFWTRWHISLSSWFKDYVYFPLGGSRKGWMKHLRNLVIVFLLSGLWHGPNWTFVLWGLLNALYLIFELLVVKRITFFSLPRTLKIVLTFVVVSLLWVFFRSPTIQGAWYMLNRLFSFSGALTPETGMNTTELVFCLMLIACLFLKERYTQLFLNTSQLRFYCLLSLLVALSYVFGIYNQKQFIYFQF
jgi:alginate O-acetyltransferase complex protein AlgI